MDIALNRADDHRAHRGRAGFGQQRLEDGHARLHGVGRHQHFGNEQNAVAEIDTDDAHAFHQGLGQDIIGSPVAAEQDVDAFDDLIVETVIKVVMHLLDQFFVVQRRQIQIVFFIHNPNSNFSGNPATPGSLGHLLKFRSPNHNRGYHTKDRK